VARPDLLDARRSGGAQELLGYWFDQPVPNQVSGLGHYNVLRREQLAAFFSGPVMSMQTNLTFGPDPSSLAEARRAANGAVTERATKSLGQVPHPVPSML
jgi:hypothetical protein